MALREPLDEPVSDVARLACSPRDLAVCRGGSGSGERDGGAVRAGAKDEARR